MILKYLKFAPYLALVVLFFLWQGNRKDIKILKNENKSLKQDSITLTADLKSTKDFVNKLQNSKTKTEEYYKDKIGSVEKEYKIVVSYKDKLLSQALNQAHDTTFIANVNADNKTLSDSLKTADLNLKYSIDYWGEIYNIGFDYKVKEKTVIQNHVIYEPVDRPVYVCNPRSYYYASYYYGGSMHEINFGFISKKNIGFGGGITIFDRKIYPKIGVEIIF